MNRTTIAGILRSARSRLSTVHDTADLDSELLLAHALGKSRTWIYTWPNHYPTVSESEQFQRLIEQRLKGIPTAYLTGKCEFWSLSLEVNPATLIPRPETELLVEQILQRVPPGATLRIADLGTGSGAIAITLAVERPGCTVVATDRCPTALATAQRNAGKQGLSNIIFRTGDWYQPLAGERFDIITSNPPYIASGDPHLQQGDLPFEPLTALTAGHDGLDAIHTLVCNSHDYLNPGGWLMVEYGFDQRAAVARLLQHSGYSRIQCYPDLAGHDRISEGQAV